MLLVLLFPKYSVLTRLDCLGFLEASNVFEKQDKSIWSRHLMRWQVCRLDCRGHDKRWILRSVLAQIAMIYLAAILLDRRVGIENSGPKFQLLALPFHDNAKPSHRPQ